MHFMHNFLSFIKKFSIPSKKDLLISYKSFSKKELMIFIVSLVIATISLLIILIKVNNYFMVTVPANGGSITEGIIGIPTLINPVLAVSDADKDLTSIIYSGLMRKTKDGTLIPDIAEEYPVSPNGLEYTFKIRNDAKFHDGVKITADDIIFTIEKIKDPLIKSPKKSEWDAISVEKIDNNTVVFKMKQPNISFINNTTIGILPFHAWKNITVPEFSLSALNNTKAIGSGPYKIESVSKNKDNVPEKYMMKRFNSFTLGKPHIKYLNVITFANEKDLIKALTSRSIDQASGISPQNAKKAENSKYTVHTTTLPRMFGLFFNKNKIFEDKNVIQAINKAIDKQDIVNQVLEGYGSIINNPIPEIIFKDAENENNFSLEEANSILEKAGWVLGEDGIRQKGGLSSITKTKKVGKKTVTEKVTVDNGPIIKLAFSITTGDTPELKKSIEIIKNQLLRIGVQVEAKIYETGQLNRLIKERDYESLFFGQIINHGYDLYSFWHSSQKNYPGNNISMYENKKIDTILEEIRKTSDKVILDNKYRDFVNEFNKDLPALFIYSPKHLYATSKSLINISLDTINTPSDRFISIYDWYASIDHVWKIFTK